MAIKVLPVRQVKQWLCTIDAFNTQPDMALVSALKHQESGYISVNVQHLTSSGFPSWF